jgi:hypothetical protein
MTLQEMLEAAHLDALGLLEDDERQAFDAAFAAANPAIQSQVRAEQARWAQSVAGFIEAEPPAYLKERVLAAVGAAMGAERADDTEALMSESRLGRELVEANGGVLGRIDGRKKSPRVSPAWRAAALGFATAAAVLLAAFLQVSSQMNGWERGAQNDGVLQAATQGFGREIFEEALFESERYVFSPVANAGGPTPSPVQGAPAATIYLLPNHNESRLFVKGVTVGVGQSARLVLLDDQGQVLSTLHEFPISGKYASEKLDLEATRGVRLGIAVANVGVAATAADVRLTVRTA